MRAQCLKSTYWLEFNIHWPYYFCIIIIQNDSNLNAIGVIKKKKNMYSINCTLYNIVLYSIQDIELCVLYYVSTKNLYLRFSLYYNKGSEVTELK